VLATLAARMAAAASPEEVLPEAAETAARGLGATRGQASLLPGGGALVRCWPAGPPDPAPDYAVAVVHRGETVGELAVTMPAGWALTPPDRNLLADLAAEAGLAFRNLRLTAELRRQLERLSATAAELAASRRRLVTAQDEERRRLGRDLRRGPQRRLDGIAGQLGPAEDALAEDPARAAALLSGLTGEANLALESLRDLARGCSRRCSASRACRPPSGPWPAPRDRRRCGWHRASTAAGSRRRSRRPSTSAAWRRWAPAPAGR
jgi:hypothetical protein